MKAKRIVVAVGGNALGRTLPEQRAAARELAAALEELLLGESQLVLAHGTGPQVGLLQQAMEALSREDPSCPPHPPGGLHRHEPGLPGGHPPGGPPGPAAPPGEPAAGDHPPHPGGGGPR